MFNTIYLLSILTHIVYFLSFITCFMDQQSSTAMFLTGMVLTGRYHPIGRILFLEKVVPKYLNDLVNEMNSSPSTMISSVSSKLS